MRNGTFAGGLAIALSVLAGPTSTGCAQQAGPSRPDPVAPYTPEAAVRAVDRFVTAFNARDSLALRDAFGASAVAFTFDKDQQFRAVDWLPFPWSYHQLQANQLDIRAGSWQVVEGNAARLSVLGRIVSSSFVAQRERISFHGPDDRGRTLEWMVHYQVSNGRILHVWIFPIEELDVPVVANPRHRFGEGPMVWFDAAHGNLDTPEGTYHRFVELLRRDGYTVRTWEGPFTSSRLDTIRVLVIVNAMPRVPADSTRSARGPSAFTFDEERAIEEWVTAGGALLLVADHQPMAGAAASLASRFGVEFRDGMVRDTGRSGGGGDVFQRTDGTLRAHPITDGTSSRPRVDSVVTYLGQAFRADGDIQPLLVMPDGFVLEEPATEERPLRTTPAGGWLQGAVRSFGRGRVALFGEAWMFRFFERGQNAEFVLNLVDWLTAR